MAQKSAGGFGFLRSTHIGAPSAWVFLVRLHACRAGRRFPRRQVDGIHYRLLGYRKVGNVERAGAHVPTALSPDGKMMVTSGRLLGPAAPETRAGTQRLARVAYVGSDRGSCAAARMSSDGLKLFVTTWGHRRHAANPSWRHHRHVARIGQRGRSSETSGKSVTTREANLQVFSLKCTQSPFRHGAAKRKTSG